MIPTRRAIDKRQTLRLDKLFAVSIVSPIFGELVAVARNISEGGMFVEMADPLPLGSVVQVHFEMPDSPGEIVAHGEVKGHYFVNFAERGEPRQVTGMGVRFLGFDDGADGLISRCLHRTLH